MTQPPPEEDLFWDESEHIEKENNMPHMTSIERRGLERGLERGRAEGRAEGQAKMLLRALERRFQVAVPEEMAARIRATTDLSFLERWMDLSFEVSSLEEFEQRMQS